MIKRLTDNLPLATLVIAFLFVCGALYLIGFWGTFNVDITNLVSITDIPKSFVLPFFISQGVFILNIAVTIILTRDFIDNKKLDEHKSKSIWWRLFDTIFSINTVISISFIIILITYADHKLSSKYWLQSSLALSFLLSIKLTRTSFFITNFTSRYFRLYLANIIVILPISSYATGKVTSLNIYNNSAYINITNITPISSQDNIDIHSSTLSSHSFKLVGFLGDKLIVSSLDNKTIIFINQSYYGTVEMTKNE